MSKPHFTRSTEEVRELLVSLRQYNWFAVNPLGGRIMSSAVTEKLEILFRDLYERLDATLVELKIEKEPLPEWVSACEDRVEKALNDMDFNDGYATKEQIRQFLQTFYR